jgi:Flp pilus assembly protein TadG
MRRTKQRGGAVVETAFLSPWIFFLFIGVFDLGFYMYDAICIESAARIAAMQTATNAALTPAQLQNLACSAALLEMNRIPNIVGISSCNALPLTVTQQTLTNSTPIRCADCSSDPTAISSLVTVVYQGSLFVTIPGIFPSPLNLTRTAEVRMVIP